MSRTIDERVVEMRFDNKQFESGVQTSLSKLLFAHSPNSSAVSSMVPPKRETPFWKVR